MKTKQRMRLEIKDITADGTFEGILSPYGNVDGGGDVVLPGAYAKTLKEQGPTRPLLWQHKADQPIGQLTLEDRADGLWCKGALLMPLAEAQKAYLLMKAGIVKGLSIGFESIKDNIANGVRQLKEIKLYEGSIVTFPMNEMAMVTSVKQNNGEPNDFADELNEIQIRSGAYQLMSALDGALCDVRCSDLTKDDQLAASQTIIEQFSEAYLSFLPNYVDLMAEMYSGMEVYERQAFEQKAKPTKRVDGADLTSDCFAYVGDAQKTETWKLPIKFPGDVDKTKAHIRNALARFSQTQGIPASERAAVLAKIQAAAKKYGIDVAKAADFEEKYGQMISATNKATMTSALDHIMSAHHLISALVADEADDSTTAKAAGDGVTPEAKAANEPEPVIDHSAIVTRIDELRALLPV